MSLSHTLNLPSLSIKGLSSLSTRPSLAVHRDCHDKFPRLFPLQLEADLLLQPFVVQENRYSIPSTNRGGKALLYQQVYNKMHYRQSAGGTNDTHSSTQQQREPSEHDMHTLIQQLQQSSDESRHMQDETWRRSMTESVPPLCTTVPFRSKDFLHLQAAELSEPSFPETSENWHNSHPGNPMTLATIGKRKALVFSPTGFLNSVTAAEISIQETDDKLSHSFKPLMTGARTPDFLLFDEKPIVDIVSSHPPSDTFERCTLLATTSNGLSLGTLEDEALQWNLQYDLSRVVATAFNPIFPEEFAVVCEEGLFAGTAQILHEALQHNKPDHFFLDIQPVSRSAQFRKVHYGAHPRTLLLANPRGIRRHDLRSPSSNSFGDVVLDIENHWGLSRKDTEVASFQPLMESDAFRIVLATKAALLYIDTRMPHAPLLDWSISLPSPVDHLAVCETKYTGLSSDVIALSSRKHCYLEVFHGVHLRNEEMFGYHGYQNEKEWRPPMPGCEVLWSDLPLAHLQQLRVPSPTAAVVLLPHETESHVSVIQWSATEGLIGQLLSIDMFQDTERDFEKPIEVVPRHLDSSILARGHQQRLVEAGEHNTPKIVKNSDFKQLPGSLLLTRLRLMFLKDALDLRERICRTDDDELGYDRAQTRVPRPFLRDIPFVLQHRANLAEEPSHERSPKKMKLEDQHVSHGPLLDSDTCTHSDRTMSHYSSEFSDPGMGNIFNAIGGGMTIAEVARHARSGMAHNSTPLGVAGLEDTLRYAPLVHSSAVEWHSTCLELHDDCHGHVDSNEEMPDWVTQTLYCVSEAEQGQSRRSSQIPEGSEYGRLLSRMESFFFA